MAIPMIDLFAGPGGLGEGFSSLRDEHGSQVFQSILSIERDEQAHKTLKLRAYLRNDVDETLWRAEGEGLPYDAKNGLMYYTGASRAKHELRVIVDADENGCRDIIERLGERARRRPLQTLARRLNLLID